MKTDELKEAWFLKVAFGFGLNEITSQLILCDYRSFAFFKK
jgi:hypothetical protein